MDRTVPKTGGEEIELYMRTYYSLLRSTETIQIESLIEVHKAMGSSLHIGARESSPDVAALIYSSLRLPPCIVDVKLVLLGQIEKSFIDEGWAGIADWQHVYASARRRHTRFDGRDVLAVFIASRSDIDDLVPILTAYQIEWNKLHDLLQGQVAQLFLSQNTQRTGPLSESERDLLAESLRIAPEDIRRLEAAWGDHFWEVLHKIAASYKHLGLRLIAGSLADYRRATAFWWRHIADCLFEEDIDLEQRAVYFVSSNTHAFSNLLSGHALRREEALSAYIREAGHEDLLNEYDAIQQSDGLTNLNNFLYYVLKKYLADQGEAVRDELRQEEAEIGFHRVPSELVFDVEAQLIEINRLRCEWADDRICEASDWDLLARSDALILNIDYPLGMAAYELLNRISERVQRLLGVYVMGKAATLNGRVNDVMIPNVVHDEHSQNTYLFNNCFAAQDVAPFMTYGTVLDNQKAISAPGTFLQNPRYMSVFYHEGYTDIEMEAGPYLSSVYEAFRPKRHPVNEIVNLQAVPFDVGFLHYASDTPMSKGHNLGASNLSYAGVDPTYATAVAILRRVLKQEARRVERRDQLEGTFA